MKDRIDIEVINHVADVRLIRTDKMNALDDAMFDALLEAGEHLRERNDVRAIVISGEGRAFCAGLDLGNFEAMANGTRNFDLAERTHGPANSAQFAVLQWRQMPVPVIGAIHGVAFGGGFQLAMGPDIRIAHPDTKLSIMEIKWGLVPDMGGMLLLRDLVRPDVAGELTYTGRMFSGTEARDMGLVTAVNDDPHAEAMSLAREIAEKNPDAIRAAKRLLSICDDTIVGRVLAAEASEQEKLVSSPNQIEAVRAAQERRVANFT